MTKELELLRERLLASARHYQGAHLDPINSHCKSEMLATADLLREAAAALKQSAAGERVDLDVADFLKSRPVCPAGSANCDKAINRLLALIDSQKSGEGEDNG